jgi:antirestriction protein ArdC
MMLRHIRGFESNGWMTYGAMQKRGFTIKKGCKNPWAWVLSPRMAFDKKDKEGKPVTNADGTQAKVMGPQRAYKVFNMDCVDTQGKAIPGAKRPVTGEPDYKGLDAVIAHHKPVITHGGNTACYWPTRDAINIPPASSFNSEAAYYATLAHEMTHWTGHSTRLDRKLMEQGGFGSEGYAFEELIAELGAAFTMARLNMGDSQLGQHASYLKGWVKKLREDKTYILKASTQASRACSFLTGFMDDTVGEDVPEAEAPQASAQAEQYAASADAWREDQTDRHMASIAGLVRSN